MAEHVEGVDIFVYTGGEQEVPDDVTHVRIDPSVKIIPLNAFGGRTQLVSVETHDGIEKIEEWAFTGCDSLRGIKLPGVREVEYCAFWNCNVLSDVEFGNKLDIVGEDAFDSTSLRKIKMPSVRTIESGAFRNCEQLTDVELPAVERIGKDAFTRCENLQRIVIPLKDNMFPLDTVLQQYTQFYGCENLTAVDLVGGIHKTISSLLLESWRNRIYQEIDRINQVLPNTPLREKTDAIQRWIRSVISRMEQYKAEHYALLKEDMTQLELAVWKAKLYEEEDSGSLEAQPAKKAKIDIMNVRKERRITSGADIIIRNVLPFLQLLE
jgi:hypothetical protein